MECSDWTDFADLWGGVTSDGRVFLRTHHEPSGTDVAVRLSIVLPGNLRRLELVGMTASVTSGLRGVMVRPSEEERVLIDACLELA